MSDDLHNLNDVIEELEGLSIKTSQGSFLKTEDVRRLLEKKKAAGAIQDKEEPKPKTIEQARSQAKKFLADQTDLPAPREPGRAIPASEAQPVSRP